MPFNILSIIKIILSLYLVSIPFYEICEPIRLSFIVLNLLRITSSNKNYKLNNKKGIR